MRKIALAILISLLLPVIGCQKITSPTFIKAVREHREDTVLVNQSLIDTFKEEQANDPRPEAKAAYQEIINNLETISRQAVTLDDYVWSQLTDDELALLLRSKWRSK